MLMLHDTIADLHLRNLGACEWHSWELELIFVVPALRMTILMSLDPQASPTAKSSSIVLSSNQV